MSATAGLEVDRLTVRYGGAVAVSELSLAAPLGQITGLIGPNGAGKSTTFNACGGFVSPTHGEITLLGRNVTRLGPSARARRGLGRTFQRMALCESLTALNNVTIAREARHAGGNPLRQLMTAPSRRRDTVRAANAALETCGIASVADNRVGNLTTGQRRLVELARVVAGRYQVLLLDEPSSGLDPAETAAFGAVLTGLVREGDVAILLVEHDMGLVMSVCQELYVLDFGRLVFCGSPDEARASDIVRAAYLGGEADIDLEEVVP